MTRYFVLVSFLLFLASCKTTPPKPEVEEWDFEQIKETGELVMITLYSSYSYYIYKDEPMGYDYDLCKGFCDEHGLELKVKVAENATRLVEMLENGEGDLIAYPVPIQNEMKDSILYCGPQRISRQVLVQRANRSDTLLTDVTQLIGKDIHVKHNTKYHQRIINLDNEIGNGIHIHDVEIDTITEEDLIEKVALGELEYTISDDYIAKLNKTYHRNIDISLPISFEQRSAWVVRKSTPKLAETLNEWIEKNDNTPEYKSITKKYFELSKLPFDGEFDMNMMPAIKKGNISPYDDLFKKHAAGTAFEWYLLASIAYHESRFQPNVSAWSGAVGLMGLMPRTAVSLGITVEDRTDPDLSIMACVKLLKKLDAIFAKIEDHEERLKFVLASYNGGHGHINDAQALARKYEENPHKWDIVRKYIDLKSNPEYYNDPVCKNGYLRGTETLRYVDQVLEYRNRFKI